MSHLLLVLCAVFAACAGASAQTCSISQGSAVVTSALLQSLLGSEDKNVRPGADCGGPTTIATFFNLLSFYRDRVNCGLFKASGVVNLSWNDSRLAWDPAQFGGIKLIRIPSNQIWTPDLVFNNNFEYRDSAYGSVIYNAVVYSSGLVNLFQPATVNAFGSTVTGSDGLDVVTFIQPIVSWTYDVNEVVLQAVISNLPTANFYDANGQEEYNYLGGTSIPSTVLSPTSTVPFSVITASLQFKSKKPVVFSSCASSCSSNSGSSTTSISSGGTTPALGTGGTGGTGSAGSSTVSYSSGR